MISRSTDLPSNSAQSDGDFVKEANNISSEDGEFPVNLATVLLTLSQGDGGRDEVEAVSSTRECLIWANIL